MKYCIDYKKDSKILNKVDEINVQFTKIQDLKALEQFCQEHINQRINICIDNLELLINEYIKSFEEMLIFQNEHQYNIYFRLPDICEELDVLLSKYHKCKFYFNIKINDWDRVIGYINYGVSDIYIVEGLGFEIEQVATIAHSHNVQIRVFPNVAQSSWKNLDDLRKFWIRPEDIDFYSQYVDVCEFYGDNEKIDIVYDIYNKDKKWFGNLNEIIIGLKQPLESNYIVPRFAKKRVKCGRECLKGGNCQMCDRIKELSGNLEKAGLVVLNNKEEEKE